MNTPVDRYDRLTRTFHWLTAAVVIFMFASAHIWENLEKGTPLRKGLQSVHISLGIALAVLILARIAWRLSGGTRLKADSHPALNLLAKMAHGCLYLLLLAQIVLGFLFRWAQGEPFNFFGLFSVPAPFAIDHAWRGTLGGLHDTVAWAIIGLAGLHACAALWHHSIKRDNTLRRMLPAPRDAV
ncbi:cytochrome b [Pseudomonas fluorescens]|jgi:cytochrome b561|uniref:Cytochrome B n=1 Tax=Pseudomonas aylmerensis TaxID=1869229 RepID=A0A2T4FQZ2_9PSED|nr:MULTISPECIES: cytochrome b [Pseudomonas]AYF47457.1 cytochrome b [Pseudomonas fluorescens]MBS7843578.1 cytochrome b [Pseudomonas fluorescens]OCW30421.1 cytochrome B [Pseudomonas aylmerensis]PTC25840.1 cytochrome b [Pseudomonas aylmerensis]QTV18473.1 cytochrome b [Pseudomonas fluorescens]